MKSENVPQDEGSLAKKNIKELCYAVDKDGNYTTKLSKGWDVKAIALNESLELIKERVADFKARCLKGEISPVQYYMEFNRMDLQVLSDYMGKWQWQIKRHFKPSVFSKLSDKIVNKYAETFNITVEQLKDITLFNENRL